jgi:hypothetical protein
MDKIEINGIQYIREPSPAAEIDGAKCVIVRSIKAGVFCGYIRERDRAAGVIVLDRCIRMWTWTGATLSQVARDGTAPLGGPNRFSIETNGHEIADVVEIIPCSIKARAAIEAVIPMEIK